MNSVVHPRTPSVGRVIKKMLAVNPDLSTTQIIAFIRTSTRRQAPSAIAGEFLQAEVVDEEQALRLARETLRRPRA